MSTINCNETQNVTFQPSDPLESYRNKLQLALLIIIMIIIILTILGNTMVLVATWREKSLHQPNKYFIACLAIADLLMGTVSMPITFDLRLRVLTEGEAVPIPVLCHFHSWVDAFAETASIYTLTFISLDRYLKISKPLHYKSRMTTSTSLKVIFIIFLISSVYAAFAIFPAHECYSFDKRYYTFLAVAAFFVPTIIMIIMYTLIFFIAHQRQKMTGNGELGQMLKDRKQKTALLHDLKIIRMLAIVVGVFVFCWGPFFIWLTLTYYAPEEISNVKKNKLMLTINSIVFILPLINSLCNPIIYACLDQTYNEAFKHLFHNLRKGTFFRREDRATVTAFPMSDSV